MKNTPTKSYIVYGDIVIDFYEKFGRYKHIYILRSNGEWLKSVTGATGIIDKPALIPWAVNCMADKIKDLISNGAVLCDDVIDQAKKNWRDVRDKSADIGTETHSVISDYIKHKIGGKDDNFSRKPKSKEVANTFIAFREWEAKNNVKFIDSEKLVYSKKYHYVGTTDCIADVNSKISLIDFKTGSGFYPEMVYQVAGYGLAYKEEHKIGIDDYYIIRFGKDSADFKVKNIKVGSEIEKGFLSHLYILKQQNQVKEILK